MTLDETIRCYRREARADVVVTRISEGNIFWPSFAGKVVLLLAKADEIFAAEEAAQYIDFGSVIFIAKHFQYEALNESLGKHSFLAWDKFGTEHGRSWVKSSGDNDHYATHLPVLLEAVKRTTGPVLELGSGLSSTPALHKLCEESGRKMTTVDNDGAWLEQFRHMESDEHKIVLLEDPATTPLLLENWGVVFVDHAPGDTRVHAIDRARGRSEYIVVHDTETLDYGVEDILSTFKYRKDFRRHRPWTTVVSDTKEVW